MDASEEAAPVMDETEEGVAIDDEEEQEETAAEEEQEQQEQEAPMTSVSSMLFWNTNGFFFHFPIFFVSSTVQEGEEAGMEQEESEVSMVQVHMINL